MQFTKPEIQRVYVQVVDARTRRGRCFTAYNVTPDQYVELTKQSMGAQNIKDSANEPKRRRAAQPA